MGENNWLESLKVGDRVLIFTGGIHNRLREGWVSNVGKKHLTVGGDKYRISTGCRTGDGYYSASIQKFDERKLEEQKRLDRNNRIAGFLREFNWRNISEDKLLRVFDIVGDKAVPNG